MKKSLMVIFVIALAIGVATSAACAGDWGCECILCMSNKKVCRKFTGHKIVERPIKWRTKPHYVELIAPDGEKRERVYYKKKRKKKGMF
jgi:hypothetical protein